MRTIKHPLSGALYDLTPDGTIQVTTPDGGVGEFDRLGRWLAGEARHADPHLCLWIGGIELPNRFQLAADALQAEADAGDPIEPEEATA